MLSKPLTWPPSLKKTEKRNTRQTKRPRAESDDEEETDHLPPRRKTHKGRAPQKRLRERTISPDICYQEENKYEIGPSTSGGRCLTAYQEKVYTRLENIAAKLDTLVNTLHTCTRQITILAETVGLQQATLESVQTTIVQSTTGTASIYPSLKESDPVKHSPVL